MVKVNPTILLWARDTMGFSLKEASEKLRIREAKGIPPVKRLQALEKGEIEPSRAMLKKMAKVYRRPLIAFYLEKPPRQANRGKDFRTLPDTFPETTTGLVDALIRNIYVRQSLLRTAMEDNEEIELLPFVGSMQVSQGVDAFVKFIKKNFEIRIEEFQNLPDPNKAFNYLRRKIEDTGVFVILLGNLGSHHTNFELDAFRGFALADDIAPFIVINEKDSKAAWSFTLIHEMTHILLGQTGISSTRDDMQIEQFCNKVASELLLPKRDLEALELPSESNFSEHLNIISDFARSKNLSSSMVAYKLYLLGVIDRQTWRLFDDTFKQLWLEAKAKIKEKRKGKVQKIPYYKIRKHRLGENCISAVQQLLLGGSLTTVKAGKVLGVSPKKIQYLFESNIQVRQLKT